MIPVQHDQRILVDTYFSQSVEISGESAGNRPRLVEIVGSVIGENTPRVAAVCPCKKRRMRRHQMNEVVRRPFCTYVDAPGVIGKESLLPEGSH